MADKGQSRTARRKQLKSKKKPIWKKIIMILAMLGLLIGIGVTILFSYYIITAPEIDAAKLSDPFSSKIYNKDGEFVTDIAADEKRTKIEYNDLPQVLIDAVTATEDARFFKHSGIDLRRIGGAIKANITNGFGSEGASTITQQVVENAFLSSDKKIKLKVQEQWLALKLERKYSKEQILEMYLNKIFYGSGAYGVAKASEIYFGKTDLHELTLEEAAILAGLPQRPSAYNPYNNPDLMKKRMDTVLTLMVRHGKITEQQADAARQVEIASLLTEKRPDSKPYEAFIQKVEKEVREKVDGANINTDGLKIYTTLDNSIQEHVEFLLTDSEENPISYPDEELQAGMVVVDTKTGGIRAIGGSRNNKNVDGWNYAFNEQGRQPGSTFKPILAYAPAIEYEKWSTYHQLNDDKPYKIGNIEFRNHNRRYQGWMSARFALKHSLNVPTLKAADEIGLDRVKTFGEGLGIQFYEDTIDIGDVIGGSSTNTTPLELAGAYSAFGNEGIYNEPYTVTKVEFPDGSSVDLKPEPKAAMSDYTAYMVTDMLKSVVREGTGTNANIPSLPVAGKTGTTNLEGKRGANNSWFAGYTTNYTISVWTGYDDHNKIIENTQVPHALFKNTMTEISKGIDTPDFVKPSSVVEVAVEKGSNPALLPSKYTPKENIVTELFVKGHEPTKQSEKFDELDPVSDLSATYNQETNEIDVEWAYSSDEDVSFEVSGNLTEGQMNKLLTTEDTSLSISEIEPGRQYTIQVVVVSNESTLKSEAKSTTVTVPGDDEAEEEEDQAEEEPDESEDNEQEKTNIPPVDGLNSAYNKEKQIINVSWNYNGPPAAFEVDVNGNKQTVQSNGIEISGGSPGNTYTITVTPIGTKGANNGVKGESRSIKQSIPDEQNENVAEDE
ncbi:PBP1A family penicillin-binding protein [Virgibacillus sp. W0430]|uniref:transglycosylase domain-containing protein n=1 Tax=Virgibacillus sp. W0430 TaxID=3391580 RepID=UPI003F489431